jgi:collagenase-like PrtC family protease
VTHEQRGATELLAPARDLECGMAAIDAGADAVYIGAARFGARARAGNEVAEIAALARYAHRYWARVYVTVNTLLYDGEFPAALRLIEQLYEAEVDALIVQDLGLLECDLPPLPLIASTQMHNHTPERVRFLEQAGFSRAILARELSLDQIRAIRQATGIELEAFVHGALCVSYSGQCYLSYAVGGRSGNRGECAQPCRRRYDLVDRRGRALVRGRHLLSLRDLNLAAHLDALLDAGVTSFKIEGRLKDRAYVVNVVQAYRRALDDVLPARGLARSSSGRSAASFTPDLGKTFNRGYTTYFLYGRGEPPGAIDTPKMRGQAVGRAVRVEGSAVILDGSASLHSGDGLTFFDDRGTLRGTTVHGVQGHTLTLNDAAGIAAGTRLYRNHDHDFVKTLQEAALERTIAVRLRLDETAQGFALTARDEDGCRARSELAWPKVAARDPGQAQASIERGLRKSGGTEFRITAVEIAADGSGEDAVGGGAGSNPAVGGAPYFLPFSAINRLRREALERLAGARAERRRAQAWHLRRPEVDESAPFSETRLTYHGNVLNARAEAFYRRHGVVEIEPAAESGLDMRAREDTRAREVMRARYCIKHQLGWCPHNKGPAGESPGDGSPEDGSPEDGGQTPDLDEPLYLVDEEGHRYELRFDCRACEMSVLF